MGSPLADGVILWQSHLDTYGDCLMLKLTNIMSNVVTPLGAILLAFFMTLSSPVAAQEFQKGLTAYQAGDYATALQEWRPLAEQGNVYAQNNLGLMHEYGRGVPQKIDEAVKWYRLAAEQGDVNAKHNLDKMYKIFRAFFKIQKPLAKLGDVVAQADVGLMYELGQGVPQDYAEAVKWYRLAAEQGDVGAQFKLGFIYGNDKGVPQNYAEAVKWYRLAAVQGDAIAQSNLGIMYVEGRGVPQDYAEAVKWYRLAADQGIAQAQSNLGYMYDYGQGVLQDNAMAHMWYNIGAANGNEFGGTNRGLIAKKMTPAAIEKAQSMARECMSSGYTKCGY